jgi:hypothetical protein
MIHHVSIPAQDPENVAKVLAELTGGNWGSWGDYFPDAHFVRVGDEHGTLIEVYREKTMLMMLDDGCVRPDGGLIQRQDNPEPPPAFWPMHFLISVPLDRDAVEKLAERHGWRASYAARGPNNHLIEFWIENRVLVEVLTSEMVEPYISSVNTDFGRVENATGPRGI